MHNVENKKLTQRIPISKLRTRSLSSYELAGQAMRNVRFHESRNRQRDEARAVNQTRLLYQQQDLVKAQECKEQRIAMCEQPKLLAVLSMLALILTLVIFVAIQGTTLFGIDVVYIASCISGFCGASIAISMYLYVDYRDQVSKAEAKIELVNNEIAKTTNTLFDIMIGVKK